MRRRLLRTSVTWLAAVALLGIGIPGSSAAPTGLRRWFGAEGGFEEISCATPGSGCPGLSAVTSFGGQVQTVHTMTELQDPDGTRRAWPARTGSKLFVAKTVAGAPATAYLSTGAAAASPITVSFGIRFHAPPVDPIVVYRHAGSSPTQTVALALTPGADLIATAGKLPLDPPGIVLATGRWHAITITYGAGAQAPIKLYVDGALVASAILPFGGPSGALDIGIVGPTSVPSQIGIDDIVEHGTFDAPIGGARINYLMPTGQIGQQRWSRSHPSGACASAGANWQYVSEDQSAQAGEEACSLETGSLVAFSGNQVDLFALEGVPSEHSPSGSYLRDLTDQPGTGDDVLGVRVRMKGSTGGGALTWGLAFVDGASVVRDSFTFDDGGTGGSQSLWGSMHERRPGGGAWSAAALDGLRLRLDSGSEGAGVRSADDVRLDYVWVP
jgi:hypothetical protein